ncbi:hypothetical protein POTOM_039965 [Populus tomentosa]|uniref:Uncharacterized protein n=1 Tax=Populus tomentosa TaxID=118781 RepID=A0A8X7Z478_POPTO|nr:hypothetical protein POTOM_039965 [Populus tomentosa]
MLQNLAFLDAWSAAEALLRFMWRPIHSPVLGAIHLIHVLLPSQMQITLLSSLQAPLLGWTSFKDGSIYLNNYTSSELVKKIKAYEQACINVVFHPVLLPAVGMGMLQYLSEHFHDGWFNSSPGNLEQTNKKANLVGNFVPYA